MKRGIKIYLMESPVECETAAIATATQTDYKAVNDAMHRIREIPDVIENVLYGNNISVYLTLIALGYWKKNLTLGQFFNGEAVDGETMMLVKEGVNRQHWAVFAGKDGDHYLFYWGYENKPKRFTEEEVIKYFTTDGPVNDCFVVYKCEDLIEMLSARFGIWCDCLMMKIKRFFVGKK